MYKLQNSALRSRMAIQDTISALTRQYPTAAQIPTGTIRNYRALLNGQDLFGAYTKRVPGGWQIGGVDRIPKEYMGMGLGKWLYGNMAKSLAPGERLFSDANVSGNSRAIWNSMINRNGSMWQAGRFPAPQLQQINPYTTTPPIKTPGITFPEASQAALKPMLPAGVKPWHYQLQRMGLPTAPVPAAPVSPPG